MNKLDIQENLTNFKMKLYGKSLSIFQEEGETSIYDHIAYVFYELMANELIETGADIGVFERRENSIDLTPWYNCNSEG